MEVEMVRDKITVNQLFELKRLGPEVGLIFAKTRYPQLDEDDLKELITNLWKHEPLPDQPRPYTDPHRRPFIAIAWLLGASLRQLGRKFRVTPQTILQNLDRELMDIPDRMAARFLPAPMEPHKLEALYDLFYRMVKVDPDYPFYRRLPILEVAGHMSKVSLETDQFQPDVERTYGDIAVPDSHLETQP